MKILSAVDFLNPLPIAEGGTGGDTAAAARTALGLGALATKATAATSDIADNSITLAKLADIATATILGRNVSGTGDPIALTVAQTLALLGFTSGTGWIKLQPGNLLIQAATVTDGSGSEYRAVTFPTAFGTGFPIVVPINGDAASNATPVALWSRTATGFTARTFGSTAAVRIDFLA